MFLTLKVHSIAVALLALTEAYASAFESFEETKWQISNEKGQNKANE